MLLKTKGASCRVSPGGRPGLPGLAGDSRPRDGVPLQPRVCVGTLAGVGVSCGMEVSGSWCTGDRRRCRGRAGLVTG